MAATIRGIGVVWSTGGVTFAGVGSGILSSTDPMLPQSLRYTRTAENTKIKSANGDIVSAVFHGFKKQLSLTVIPSGAAGAGALTDAWTSKEAHLVNPGTKVTIDDDSGSTQIEQNWLVISAKENRTVDGAVTIDMELVNAESDISTAIAAS